MNRVRFAALTALLLYGTGGAAEPAWIGDRLRVGLHERADPGSGVLMLLSSGTPVEVLEREDGLARVRTGDGSEGWMDAIYLSQERPSALLLAEVEAARADAVAKLEAAQERIARLEGGAPEPTAGDDEAGNGDNVQAASFEAPVNSETLRELQRLAEENQRIRQSLAEAEAVAAMALEQVEQVETRREAGDEVSAPAPGSAYEHYLLALRDWSRWQWLALLSTLALAFVCGVWLADRGVRRRHGGFRLRV